VTAPQPITLDKSSHLVLVLCARCPGWREAAGNEAEAWTIGRVHMDRVHDDRRLAADYRGRVARFNAPEKQSPST